MNKNQRFILLAVSLIIGSLITGLTYFKQETKDDCAFDAMATSKIYASTAYGFPLPYYTKCYIPFLPSFSKLDVNQKEIITEQFKEYDTHHTSPLYLIADIALWTLVAGLLIRVVFLLRKKQ